MISLSISKVFLKSFKKPFKNNFKRYCALPTPPGILSEKPDGTLFITAHRISGQELMFFQILSLMTQKKYLSEKIQ